MINVTNDYLKMLSDFELDLNFISRLKLKLNDKYVFDAKFFETDLNKLLELIRKLESKEYIIAKLEEVK